MARISIAHNSSVGMVHGWNNPQWQFKDGDAASGNRTVPIVEGGYCVYLNDTVKVDVTTPNVNGVYLRANMSC